MNVKELLVDLNLFNSLINRAIYNQCEIVLFDESKPEKFEVEIAELASRHADTVTVYKSLDGKTMFASDLHFNPYGVKVIASVEGVANKIKDHIEDVLLTNKDGKTLYINRVKIDSGYPEEVYVKFSEYPSKEDFDNDENEDKSEKYLENFPSFLEMNNYDTSPIPKLDSLIEELEEEVEAQKELENSDEYGNIKGILKVLDENSDGIQKVYTEYSGRGMYGSKCFGVIVDRYSYDDLKEEFDKMGVGGSSDNMGLDMIIYWPRYKYEQVKSEDEEGILRQFDKDEGDDDDAEASAYALEPMIQELESKGYTVLDEGSHEDMTVYVANSKEEFTDDIFLALIFGNEELVDIVNSNFREKYAGKYAEIEKIAAKFEKKDEAEAVRMESLANISNVKESIKAELEENFDLHPGSFIREGDNSITLIGNCGCHDTLMDLNGKKMWGYEHFNPKLVSILDKHNAWPEADNSEAFTINLEESEANASKPTYDGLPASPDEEEFHKKALEKRDSVSRRKIVWEVEGDDIKFQDGGFSVCISEEDGDFYISINGKDGEGFGTLEGAKDYAKEKYEEFLKSTALHPEQKGGQEIKLRKIAEKYIDEVAKHANTGIVQHAILDQAASDLNKDQISAVRKALVEVGNRNMGNDRIRKEGKEGVIAGSDIAEWASWITSDCMAFTADYLMESIGDRNAKDTYTFAKSKLEDCLMDFYRNEMNKSNYPDVYAFWEDLIYGKKAFGASEDVDFFTVYLMKEKTPEEIQDMCKQVEEAFETECAIIDDSAFNVMKIGKLRGNETAMNDVASLIGQSEVLEIA